MDFLGRDRAGRGRISRRPVVRRCAAGSFPAEQFLEDQDAHAHGDRRVGDVEGGKAANAHEVHHRATQKSRRARDPVRRQSMGSAGAQRIRTLFTWELAARRLLAALTTAL